MKKIIAILLSAAMLFTLALPCFAASPARFNINLVSEDSSSAVITVDYEGGGAFSAFDFEIKINEKKLKVTEAIESDGLDNFKKDIRKNGDQIISTIYPNGGRILASTATTAPFRVVNGKDLFVITLKKLTKDNLAAADISLKFTSCTDTNGAAVNTAVTSSVGGTATTSAAQQPDADGITAGESKSAASESTSVSESSSVSDADSSQTLGTPENETSFVIESTEGSEPQVKNTKKIITVAAAAVCALFVIAAVCVYVVKKTKGKDSDED